MKQKSGSARPPSPPKLQKPKPAAQLFRSATTPPFPSHHKTRRKSTMEPLTSAPDTSSFTPLSVHQSRTPESFHSGPAILHYHASSCKLVALERDIVATPTLNALRSAGTSTGANGTHPGSGDADENEKEALIEGVDVWVTSEYAPPFPFPSLLISIHNQV